MKKFLKIITIIGAMTLSFIFGQYTGYWNTPGMEIWRAMEDSGMSKGEIHQVVNEGKNSFADGFDYEYTTMASYGLATLKALDDDDFKEAEDIAIQQITQYYKSVAHDNDQHESETVADYIEEYSPNNPKLQKALSELSKSP